MLKNEGQLVFLAFGKSCTDDVFERLDQGKWVKYNHIEGCSPFHDKINPVEEYSNLFKRLGYNIGIIKTKPINTQWTEESFQGE